MQHQGFASVSISISLAGIMSVNLKNIAVVLSISLLGRNLAACLALLCMRTIPILNARYLCTHVKGDSCIVFP